MAFDFPSNPLIGDTAFDPDANAFYEWDGTAWQFKGQGTSYAAAVAAGADFPNNPVVGETFNYLGSDWIWDGVAWVIYDATADDVDWADIVNKPTAFPPTAHTHVEADIVDLDKYTTAEVDAQQAVQDAAIQQNVDDIIDANAGIQQNFSLIGDNAVAIAQNAADILLRMRWAGEWDGSLTYELNDVVTDQGWLAVANKQTTERPAPVEIGTEGWKLIDNPPWVQQDDSTDAVTVGLRYTPVIDDLIKGFRFWTRPGFTYNAYYVPNAEALNPTFRELGGAFDADAEGWVETSIEPQFLSPGDVIDLFLVIKPTPGTTTNVNFSATWTYIAAVNQIVPNSGTINHPSKNPSRMRVSKNDFGGTDRSASLLAYDSGSTITIGGTIWQVIGQIDGPGYVEFIVTPTVQAANQTSTVAFSKSVAATVSHVVYADRWLTASAIDGRISTTGYGDMVSTDDAYGIDFRAVAIDFSDDWDIMLSSEGGGGSGGGGSNLPANSLGVLFNDGAGALSWEDIGTPNATEIVEDDVATDQHGYIVIGDMLLQWGQEPSTGVATPVAVTYPIPFKRNAAVTIGQGWNNRVYAVGGLTATGFTCNIYLTDGTNAASWGAFFWCAIGEAPDALKKPKSIIGGVGGDTGIVEIVESDLTDKWQVWGDLLIQWGTVQTNASGNAAVTYPKQFKAVPTVELTPTHATLSLVSSLIGGSLVTGFNSLTARNDTGAATGANIIIYWVAVGEALDVDKKAKSLIGGVGDPGPVEIVADDTASGWFIAGDTLFQWGTSLPGDGTSHTVTFQKAFKTSPKIQATMVASSAAGGYTAQINAPSATDFIISKFSPSNVLFAGNAYWFAVGEALDADKLQKSVHTVGEAYFEEFHDPTGVKSWRIIGNTLECWGEITTAASPTLVTFPKQFARKPTMNVSVERGSVAGARFSYHANVTVAQFNIYSTDGTSHQNVVASWRAIGEWDGVS